MTTAMSTLTIANDIDCINAVGCTDAIDCNIFGQICGKMDPISICAFTQTAKQFLNSRSCVTAFVIQDCKSLIYNKFLPNFLHLYPNVRDIRINDIDWTVTTADQSIWITTSHTLPDPSLVAYIELFFDYCNASYIAYRYVAFDSPEYETTFRLTVPNVYMCQSSHGHEYQHYDVDRKEIRANLRGADTCYDIVVEMPYVVENIRLGLTFDLTGTTIAVDHVQLNRTTYKITSVTAEKQLVLFNAFWFRQVVVTYDNIDIAGMKPFKLSYTKCRIIGDARYNIASEMFFNTVSALPEPF